MPVRYTQLLRRGGALIFAREIVLKDGSVGIQSVTMSPETFSIRAGEYGLDLVDDADLVWDIILNEIHLTQEVSPLYTEDTLEAARDKHVAQCLAERDKLEGRPSPKQWSSQEQEDHDNVLAALRTHCPADQQLSILFRQRTREQVKEWKREQRKLAEDTVTPIQKMKRKMLDDIQQREDLEIRSHLPSKRESRSNDELLRPL